MEEEDTHNVETELEDDPHYNPPPEKSIDDILAADKEDASLQQYKATLLGSAAAGTGAVVVDENDPRKVIVKALALVVEGREDVTMDLTEDLSVIKTKKFVIKEGIKFRIRIDFIVQREIVHGLKYVQKTYRAGINVDKMTHMVGSYAPKLDLYSTLTPMEDAPSGMMKRGTYSVGSVFTDDDKTEHLKWEWSIEIKKDWD
ncbi:rho GDP-dissociation inhibitor 2 [Eurytemora carolleeae]|uniref:rho GDP-dissociation inhibitor 2 n=1 Tax=Eurytemora carolleeae TaxID=1294199 RepID=UPI000C784CF4|nr:rho GDP-dissociation inhibitor 2 [Eurytemora carolleeae]|eukprot:XP_023325537.1 rho GDP-dissociation inhibitor 2-like [Eurytemora affinis]